MSDIDINVENYKDMGGLKKKLFLIFKAITAKLKQLETEGTTDSALESRVALIENNYMSKAQQFPLGYNTTCKYTRASSFNVGDTSTVLVTFDQESDTNDYIVRTGNEYVCQEDGIYDIYFSALFNTSPSTATYRDTIVQISINGSSLSISRDANRNYTATIPLNAHNTSLKKRLNKNDIIQVSVYQNSSPNQTLEVSESGAYTFLTIDYQGKNDDAGFTPVPVPPNYQIPDGSVTGPKLGVGAGNIIEEITNLNGTAVKWETGFMVCTHEIAVPEITASFGPLYRSTSETTWTYPVSFVGNEPWVGANDKNSTQVQMNTTSNGGTSAGILGVFPVSLAGARTAKVIAIGRWK